MWTRLCRQAMLANLDRLYAGHDVLPPPPPGSGQGGTESGELAERLSGLALGKSSGSALARNRVPDEDACRVYYKRQLLTRSLQGRRIDLITITDCHGATGEAERPPSGVLQLGDEHGDGTPAAVFPGKTVRMCMGQGASGVGSP
eukprot:365028-Chlamydomonas_euryale.AAC.27